MAAVVEMTIDLSRSRNVNRDVFMRRLKLTREVILILFLVVLGFFLLSGQLFLDTKFSKFSRSRHKIIPPQNLLLVIISSSF